jgi:hypothetical protein
MTSRSIHWSTSLRNAILFAIVLIVLFGLLHAAAR